MQVSLSQDLNVDREILLNLGDNDLLNCCSLNKYFLNKVCDDLFFKRILQIRYINTLQFFDLKQTQSHKKYYLNVVFYITKLKQYNFSYSTGNPKLFYDLFKIYLPVNIINMKYLYILSITAADSGYIEIIEYGVNLGLDIHTGDEYLLSTACRNGHLDIIKYLVKLGADIHINGENALIAASINGHLEVVKYLISLDPTQKRIKIAHKYGKLNIINYLYGSNLFSFDSYFI